MLVAPVAMMRLTVVVPLTVSVFVVVLHSKSTSAAKKPVPSLNCTCLAPPAAPLPSPASSSAQMRSPLLLVVIFPELLKVVQLRFVSVMPARVLVLLVAIKLFATVFPATESFAYGEVVA